MTPDVVRYCTQEVRDAYAAWRAEHRNPAREVSRANVAMLMGGVDTGKTTLALQAARLAIGAGRTVAIVDADVGNSTVGPPAVRRIEGASGLRRRTSMTSRRPTGSISLAPSHRRASSCSRSWPQRRWSTCPRDRRPGDPRHHSRRLGGGRRDPQVPQGRAVSAGQGRRPATGRRDGAGRRDAAPLPRPGGDRCPQPTPI